MSTRTRTTPRAELLARREKNRLPWGTSTASVNGQRNLLYLQNAGVIAAQPQSPRVAAELHLDNTARAVRKDKLQTKRGELQAIQGAANEHLRKGSSSIPARNAAIRAALRG